MDVVIKFLRQNVLEVTLIVVFSCHVINTEQYDILILKTHDLTTKVPDRVCLYYDAQTSDHVRKSNSLMLLLLMLPV